MVRITLTERGCIEAHTDPKPPLPSTTPNCKLLESRNSGSLHVHTHRCKICTLATQNQCTLCRVARSGAALGGSLSAALKSTQGKELHAHEIPESLN
eukprot:3016356-Amphidinium_carterae.1